MDAGPAGVFLDTVGAIEILPRVLDAAARFQHRPPDEAMRRLSREWELEPLFV